MGYSRNPYVVRCVAARFKENMWLQVQVKTQGYTFQRKKDTSEQKFGADMEIAYTRTVTLVLVYMF